ncbi:MAG: hypothetical protein QM679_09045 [Patulibacter sp.]
MSHPLLRAFRRAAQSRRGAASRFALFASLLVALVGMTPALSHAAEATVTTSDLCNAWNAEASAPQVTLASGYKITGNTLTRTGSSCSADNASVAFTNSAISEVAPGSSGNAVSRVLAAAVETAVGSDDVKVGDEVFSGASITSLTTELYAGWIGIRGGLAITWSGGTVTKFQFEGRFYGVDRFSMSLHSPDGEAGTSLPNIGGDPIVFSGDLVRDSAGFHLNLTGSASALTFGSGDQQIALTDGTLKLTVANVETGDGLKLAASGNIGLGSNVKITDGSIDAEFDSTGLLSLAGGGSLDATIPATASSAAGSVQGEATISYQRGGAQSVAFSGTAQFGDALIASAEGSVNAQAASISGNITFASDDLKITGAVDGAVYYGDDLSGLTVTDASGDEVVPTKGDFLLKSASADVSAQGLKLGGKVSLGSVAGEQWATAGGDVDLTAGYTRLTGSADLEWSSGQGAAVTFSGTITTDGTTVHASGTLDGKKLTFTGDAAFTATSLAIEGDIEGVVFYGDPAGDTLANAAGEQVTARKGDFVVKAAANGQAFVWNTLINGNITVAQVGGSMYAAGGGSLSVTSGSVKLNGDASFTWQEEQYPVLNFAGSVTAGTTTVAGASGTLDGRKLTFTGDAKVTGSDYTLTGAATGLLYYGNPAGRKIENRDGVQVAASKGDYIIKTASGKLEAANATLTGQMSAGQAAGVAWLNASGSIDVTVGDPATTIKGSASFVTSSTGTPALTFEGSVTSGTTVITGKGAMDGKKIVLSGTASYSSTALTIAGSVDGVVYYGDPAGDTLADASGKQVAARTGDYLLKSVAGLVTVQNLSLGGEVSLGKVAGTQYATGGGSVALTSGTTVLQGSANFAWSNGQTPSVTFTGSVTTNGTTIASASGTLDDRKLSLKGSVAISDTNYSLSGSVDGVVYYGTPLSGDTITDRSGNQVAATKGDYALAGASGSLTAKGITLSGAVSAGKVGSQQWATGGGSVNLTFGSPATTIKGSGSFTWQTGNTGTLNFEGSVTQGDTVLSGSGAMDGKKLVFSGSLASPTLSGNGSGVVYYGTDLSGETITNRAGQTVAASRGDFTIGVTNGKAVLKQLTATADFTAKKVGTVAWANVAAQIKVGSTWLTFTGEVDSAGNVNLSGAGTAVLDGYTINFNGTAVVQNNALKLTGTADIITGLFSVRLSGTIEKADMNSSTYTFTGSGGFRFGGYTVSSATIRLISGEGITTSFQIKACVLLLCSTGTYKLYFTGQEISRIQLSAPAASWAVFFAIAKIAAPKVTVETTITGII